MIIWLASYPKSGNTLLRSILSTYFYSKDGVLKFENLNKISQFPQTHHFLPLGIDIENDKEVFKNFINTQIFRDIRIFFIIRMNTFSCNNN